MCVSVGVHQRADANASLNAALFTAFTLASELDLRKTDCGQKKKKKKL